MEPVDIWKSCLEDVTKHISPQHFATWFKPIKVVGSAKGTLELEVPNRFFLEWIKEHYLPLIEDVLRKVGEEKCVLSWSVSEEASPNNGGGALESTLRNRRKTGGAKGTGRPKGAGGVGGTGGTGGTGGAGGAGAQKKGAKGAKGLRGTRVPGAPVISGIGGAIRHAPLRAAKNPRAHSLSSRYTFENFIVGKANEFAHAACFAVTNNPGSKYNPLFVYGGVGLGKTHLLQAVGNRMLQYSAKLNVCYYTSERFMNEFINFVSRQKMTDFRKRFRNVDVLLIDDIQFWGGKERTQEEFFHTFNALYEDHKQIVVTSDQFPKDIDGIEERLRSRFEWGLVADIQPPDTETKMAILKNKALAESVTLPDDVLVWLANVSSSNIRELEGYLNRVLAVSSLTGQEITLATSKEALKNLTREKEKKRLTVSEIQKAVSSYYNLKVAELKSKRRHKSIAVPRQVAMYISRQYGKFSYPEIGHAFGGKDHSTAIHSVKKIEKALGEDTEIKGNVKKILNSLGVN